MKRFSMTMLGMTGALAFMLLIGVPMNVQAEETTFARDGDGNASGVIVDNSDKAIANRVEAQLGYIEDLAVSVDDGVITLMGTVRDQDEMDAALTRAKNVDGVRSIVNRLLITR